MYIHSDAAAASYAVILLFCCCYLAFITSSKRKHNKQKHTRIMVVQLAISRENVILEIFRSGL